MILHKLTETAKVVIIMHEHNRLNEQENKTRDRIQQNFEDEMEEMLMDLRYFIC